MRIPTRSDRSFSDLVFLGVGRRVVALDRESGENRWDWKCPKAGGYTSLLLDGDRLLVAVNGYVYCLDPLHGDLLWENPLKGMGMGVTSIATVRGATDPTTLAQAAAQAGAAASAASGGA